MTPHDLSVELVRASNERNLDATLDLFAPSAEVCFPRHAPRRVFTGRAELGELFRWLVHAMPQQTIAVDRIVGTERSAIVEFEATGVSRWGRHFDNVGAMVIDAEDGRIVSARLYLDTADLGRILGPAVA